MSFYQLVYTIVIKLLAQDYFSRCVRGICSCLHVQLPYISVVNILENIYLLILITMGKENMNELKFISIEGLRSPK